MGLCKYCGTKKIFLKFDENNICSLCRDETLKEIYSLQTGIAGRYSMAQSNYLLAIHLEEAMDKMNDCIAQLERYISYGYKQSLLFPLNIPKSQFQNYKSLLARLSEDYPGQKNYKLTTTYEWAFDNMFNKNLVYDLQKFFAPEICLLNAPKSSEEKRDKIETNKHWMYAHALNSIYKYREEYPQAAIDCLELCDRAISNIDSSLYLARISSGYTRNWFSMRKKKLEKIVAALD